MTIGGYYAARAVWKRSFQSRPDPYGAWLVISARAFNLAAPPDVIEWAKYHSLRKGWSVIKGRVKRAQGNG